MQRATGTVISGSQALQFFRRERYAGSDLDLYCRFDTARAVGEHLQHAEGYIYVPKRGRPGNDPHTLEWDRGGELTRSDALQLSFEADIDRVVARRSAAIASGVLEDEDMGPAPLDEVHRESYVDGEYSMAYVPRVFDFVKGALTVQLCVTYACPMDSILRFFGS